MKRFALANNAGCNSRGASSCVGPRPPALRPRGALIALFLVVFVALALAARADDGNARRALLIDVKGAIGFVSATQLTKALEKAKTENAHLLIIRLDTPGGLLSSTRDMVQAMLASPVPVVVYVAPSGARAASAGTYLLYASHLAAMAPGTHLGAATPVNLGAPGLPGSPPDSDKRSGSNPSTAEERKAVNDAAAYLRTLAELKNRNVEWAEKAVREAATLTATDALKKRVIEVIAGDVGEVLAAINGRTVTTSAGLVTLDTKGVGVTEIERDWKMDVMSVLTDPNIAFILLLIGVYGMLFEFMSPGAVAPGVIGGISLIVALTALSVMPVSYGGLALLLLGIALMVLEGVTPSFGALGLGGIVAFVVGALFLFNATDGDGRFAIAWPVVAGAAAVSAAFLLGVLGLALQARRRPVRTGGEEMIGRVGEVVSWSDQRGLVRVRGELWDARGGQSFSVGQEVRVSGRTGLTLTVEAAT